MYLKHHNQKSTALGILTMNRAERHNAFDGSADRRDHRRPALRAQEAHPQVRAVMLSSTGKSFCAGADLNWMKACRRLLAGREPARCAQPGDAAVLPQRTLEADCRPRAGPGLRRRRRPRRRLRYRRRHLRGAVRADRSTARHHPGR